MIAFLATVPEEVTFGCLFRISAALAAAITLFRQSRWIVSQIDLLIAALETARKGAKSLERDGLSLTSLDILRSRCERLPGYTRDWWTVLDDHVEQYVSPQDTEGWFLTELANRILP
jgi:hypothetical protein